VEAPVIKIAPNPDAHAFGLDAIDRILAAIGEKHIPPNLDKYKLKIGLTECLATYHAAVERNSDRPTKNKIRRLNSIRTAAARFRKQLASDEIWDLAQHYEAEYIHHSVGILISSLDVEIDILTSRLEYGPDLDEAIRLKVEARKHADRWKARSPVEWLTGYYLPELFRKQFGIGPTFHRTADNLPDSPMIRFIERALIELGITNRGRPYSRETIAKAVTDVRTGRVRKKGRRDVGQN
jgi:hypothetical protein